MELDTLEHYPPTHRPHRQLGRVELLFMLGGRSVGRARTTGADLTLQLCSVPDVPKAHSDTRSE